MKSIFAIKDCSFVEAVFILKSATTTQHTFDHSKSTDANQISKQMNSMNLKKCYIPQYTQPCRLYVNKPQPMRYRIVE